MKKIYTVTKKIAKEMERFCARPTKENLGRGEVLFDREIVFEDGCRMAIQVIASETPNKEAAWTQGILFTPEGREIGCTDVGETFLGEYQVGTYICEIIVDNS